MIDASSILKNCVDIVLQSGEIIREHWELPSNVRHKGSIDLVTQTDLVAGLKRQLLSAAGSASDNRVPAL